MDFKQAEEKFKQLKGQFESGKLTENAFKARLEELMIRDESGTWWMIGYETENWYRNDGTDWIQSNPPGRVTQGSSQTSTQASTQTSNWSAIFGLTVAWAVGGAAGGGIYWGWDNYLGALGGAVAGVIGGLVTAFILRTRRILPDLVSVAWIALGWAIGGSIGWPVGEALTEVGGAAIGGAIVGVIGWAITSRFVPGLANWKNALWIILAWAISAAISWVIAREIQFNINGAIGWPVGRAISGAISGFVLAWQIRKE